jgi:hypothetical protein
MATCQLNVRVEQALAAQLRSEAKRQHTTPGALVAQALELLLSGATHQAHQPLAADSRALAAQLAALAERVERLEQTRPASPERVKPSPPERGELIPQTGDPVTPRTGDALTSVELAERTGTNRGAWNNWAVKAQPGQVRHHPQAGAWRLIGKVPAPGGGPDRWLWEPLVSSPQP